MFVSAEAQTLPAAVVEVVGVNSPRDRLPAANVRFPAFLARIRTIRLPPLAVGGYYGFAGE